MMMIVENCYTMTYKTLKSVISFNGSQTVFADSLQVISLLSFMFF